MQYLTLQNMKAYNEHLNKIDEEVIVKEWHPSGSPVNKQIICKACGSKHRLWVGSKCYAEKLCAACYDAPEDAKI